MNKSDQNVTPTSSKPAAIEYEAPAIESVISASELEREVQYAGSTSFRPPV